MSSVLSVGTGSVKAGEGELVELISGPLGGCAGLGPHEETPSWEGT